MEFQVFLTAKLKEKKIDVGVYHSYLMGILDDSLEEDEKREMVQDILASLIEGDTETLVNEIFSKWNEVHTEKKPSAEKLEAVDIAELLKTTTNISLQTSSLRSRQLTDEEKRIKEQILASYSQTETPEEDEEENDYDNDEGDPDLEKNTNKSDVQKLAREKREQAKLDSEQKKLKDKEDRSKQKASKEDKKKARQSAAVKGERKR